MSDFTRSRRWVDLTVFLLGRRLSVRVGEPMERLPAYADRWCTRELTDRATARRMFERNKDEILARGDAGRGTIPG